MRDPNLDMEQTTAMRHQATNGQSDSRRGNQKSARVAFGPDLETYIPRDRSPTPLTGHHRSFTSVGQKQPSLSTLARPTDSSPADNAVVSEAPSRVPSDRASDNGRPTTMLKRVKSDYGPRLALGNAGAGNDEDITMRHGWQEEFTSSEYLKALHSVSRNTLFCAALALELTSDSNAARIFTCTSPRSVTRPMVFQEIRLAAGQLRIGA